MALKWKFVCGVERIHGSWGACTKMVLNATNSKPKRAIWYEYANDLAKVYDNFMHAYFCVSLIFFYSRKKSIILRVFSCLFMDLIAVRKIVLFRIFLIYEKFLFLHIEIFTFTHKRFEKNHFLVFRL